MAVSRREMLASMLAAGPAPAIAQRQRRPNIVLILSDDHRYDAMSCAGHPWLKTPNLDRLAARGARFANAFVTTSLCSPSRASILTGQYMHAHGVVDNFTKLPKDLATFPKVLQSAGYRTAFFGKWHMGDSKLITGGEDSDSPQPGFDKWVAFPGQGAYVDPLLNFNGTRRKVKGYISDILTNEAVEYLDSQDGDAPFCLYLSHKAVHAGFEPTERHQSLYANHPVSIPASATVREGKPDWLLKKRDISRHGLNNLYAGQFTFEHLYRQYMRTVMGIDASVGAVLDTLEKRGLSDNTLVIYLGDNGFLLGEQGLVDKRVMHEPSIRVPMLAAWPGRIPAGTVRDELALNLDIAPTFVDAAGLPPVPSMHGNSLLKLFGDRPANWRKDFVYEYFWDWEALHTPGVLGLRTERHSFMEYQGIWDINELYEIQSDPQQIRNLIASAKVTTQAGGWLNLVEDKKTRELLRSLRARMVKILNETGGAHLTSGPQ
ncbi:MAG: sulfatase [Bryobacterales bacterium]|nr:sulfatase [Bryobacterales bacterium]